MYGNTDTKSPARVRSGPRHTHLTSWCRYSLKVNALLSITRQLPLREERGVTLAPGNQEMSVDGSLVHED